MKTNKYTYENIIQQHYGQGWEDVSAYDANSNGISSENSGSFVTLKSGRKIELSLLTHDLKEYRLTGYPTRVVFRKTLNDK